MALLVTLALAQEFWWISSCPFSATGASAASKFDKGEGAAGGAKNERPEWRSSMCDSTRDLKVVPQPSRGDKFMGDFARIRRLLVRAQRSEHDVHKPENHQQCFS